MSTTVYLRNRKEIAIAAKILTADGYPTTQRDIATHDRYVLNLTARVAYYDKDRLARRIESAIYDYREIPTGYR